MPYNSNMPTKHGRAEYNSYMQLEDGAYAAIPQGSDTPDGKNEYFARLVYQVNATPITGDISVDSVGIDSSGEVDITSGALHVMDIGKELSLIVRTEDPYTYVMEAETGTGTSGDAIWRIRRVRDQDNWIVVEWADGDQDYNKVASNYSILNYSL